VTAALSRRRFIVSIASLLAVALAAVLTVVLTRPGPAPRERIQGRSPAEIAEAARFRAVQDLLHARSEAIVGRDRAAFLAVLDPAAKGFRRDQARMFAHLAPVPIATWSYDLTAESRRPPPDAERYGAPIWSPSYFVLHYRLAGFDDKPTALQQYPTFVQRDGKWYLASLRDYAPRLVSATDIWDHGPVKVIRRRNVLVLGSPTQAATMTEVANQAQASIGAVSAVWRRSWSRHVVVLVPRTTRQMALLAEFDGDVSKLAALTSAEVSTTAGSPTPVGDRITINPVTWPMLSEVGARVVIRHELTHVATRASTSAHAPTWLSEGLADYIGFLDAPVSVRVAASALARLVANGEVPDALPRNRDFRSSNPQLAVHYEASWLACRYIAERFGERTLVRFYRAIGTSPARPSVAVADATRKILGMGVGRFVARWRGYLTGQLA
jgi:hypothetical protein